MGNSPNGNSKPATGKSTGDGGSVGKPSSGADTAAAAGTGTAAGTGAAIDPGSIEPVADAGADKPKRGRGRPKSTGAGAGESKPKRGRPKKASTADLDVGTITLALGFVSGFISTRFNEPILKLDDDEAAQIADATANVAKHYDVPVSPLTQAWVALGMTVGSIYAGKIAAIKFRKTAEKEAQQKPPVAM